MYFELRARLSISPPNLSVFTLLNTVKPLDEKELEHDISPSIPFIVLVILILAAKSRIVLS